MSDLTYQQKLVFERLSANHEMLITMDKELKSRTTYITTASTAIVGIITAAKFLPENSSGEGFEFILLALVCLLSVGVYGFAALIWRGGVTVLPGHADLDQLYEGYISKAADSAYCNALSDLCFAFEANLKDNMRRGRLLDGLVICFVAQLGILAIAISYSSIAS